MQSFFHKLSRSPKVLIFNNFANCLVALNASINFLLYCCFSGRFRSTFKSSFAFLTKYCVHYIEPNWKLTTQATKHGASMDNVSFNVTYNQSNYSLHGPALNTRISNMSTDASQKGLKQTISNVSQLQPPIAAKPPPQRWSAILSKFSSHGRHVKGERPDLKQTLVWQSTDTVRSSFCARHMTDGVEISVRNLIWIANFWDERSDIWSGLLRKKIRIHLHRIFNDESSTDISFSSINKADSTYFRVLHGLVSLCEVEDSE